MAMPGEHLKEHEILGIKNKVYNDGRYVKKTGDSMTGTLNVTSTTDNAIIIKSGKRLVFDGA